MKKHKRPTAGASSAPRSGSVNNRFHIDIRSPTFRAGDMEWAKALFALNDFLPKIGLPHFEAHLEEYTPNIALSGANGGPAK